MPKSKDDTRQRWSLTFQGTMNNDTITWLSEASTIPLIWLADHSQWNTLNYDFQCFQYVEILKLYEELKTCLNRMLFMLNAITICQEQMFILNIEF
jgi:hypothetical protein